MNILERLQTAIDAYRAWATFDEINDSRTRRFVSRAYKALFNRNNAHIEYYIWGDRLSDKNKVAVNKWLANNKRR